MKFHQLSLGHLGTNCYIVAKENAALIIDPGAEAERVIYFLKQYDLNPIAVMLTHGHFDHIGAIDQLRDYYQIPVSIHPAEQDWLNTPELNSSNNFPLGEIIMREPDELIELGVIEYGQFKFEVIHTPGHSPGGVSFIFEQEETIISGDCLFNGGIGRTDLVGGDQVTLITSIQELYQQPDHFKVLSGHGPITTIGKEKKSNPFVRCHD